MEWAEGWFERIRMLAAVALALEYERTALRMEKLWQRMHEDAAWDLRIPDLELEFRGRWFVVRREELRPEDMVGR